MSDNDGKKARALGINHVVLEVGDLDAALEFYGAIFDFTLRGKGEHNAFIDLGDQFINFAKGREQPPDTRRHLGLVVDSVATARKAVESKGIELSRDRGCDFLDPWGNRIQLVEYADIQFTKAPEVLRGMGLEGLGKTEDAHAQLAKKGMAVE